MSAREAFILALHSQPLSRADVLFLAAGDGMNRIPYAAKLYREAYAPAIAIVSGDRRFEYGSAPASDLAQALVEEGVPQSALVLEETAMNTKEESARMLDLARAHSWKSVLLVTSPHHQYRMFLTWLATFSGAGIALINAPAPLAGREDLLAQEFERIENYRAQGDVASYEEGLEYLQ